MSNVIPFPNRQRELEAAAWRLLVHDAAAARRERHELCTEAQAALDYFRVHGVPDGDGGRVAPEGMLYGHLFGGDTA